MAAMFFAAMYGGIFVLIVWAGVKLFRRRKERFLEEIEEEEETEDAGHPPSVLPSSAPDAPLASTTIACDQLVPGDIVHCMTERGSYYLFKALIPAEGLFLLKGRRCREESFKRWQEVRLEGTVTKQGVIFKRFVVGGGVRVWLLAQPGHYMMTSFVVRLLRTPAEA